MSPKIHRYTIDRATVHFFAPQVGVAVLCWMLAMSCAPTSLQPTSIPNTQAVSPSLGATEINNVLATLARTGSSTTADYQIGPEDLLQITIFNVTEPLGVLPRTLTIRVNHGGVAALPLLGEVKVAGLTVGRLERELAERFKEYIRNPQINVLVTEYKQRVSVIGAVQKAGVFELTGPKTVIDMLALAGGVTDTAGTQVHIYRQGANGRESHVIDLLVLASNASLITAENAGVITMPVQPGDVINVPSAGTFFVDGAVKNPGPKVLGRRYTLTQALAAAGGVDRELYSSDITIFRRKDSSGIQPINVDLDNILAGSVADVQIEADDVIVVPISGGKYFVKRFVGQLVGGGISMGSLFGS
jgi:polysaccharide export outer membrane protein